MAIFTAQRLVILALIASIGVIWICHKIDQKTDDEIEQMLHKRLITQFANFMEKYHKTYASDEEQQYRFKVFEQNYIQIYRHNKFLVFSKVGVNQFADLTEDEFKAMYTGHSHTGDDADLPGDTHKTLPTDGLPDSFDWRDHGAVTSVKTQSGCGGCWAFSTVASIESLKYIQTGVLEDLSTQQVIDCCRIDESGCVGGDPAPAFSCIRSFGGIESQADYPYLAKQQRQCDFDDEKISYQISGFVDVPSDQAQVKAALLQQPLSICLDSSDISFKYYTSGVITECEDGEDSGPDHCLLLVGYGHDDNLDVDYWLIRNQWGTQWGEDGYVKIQRDDNDHTGPGKCYVVAEVRYPVANSIDNTKTSTSSQ